MRAECPIDMKQAALEREFHKLSLYIPKTPNFDLFPVPPGFARTHHILNCSVINDGECSNINLQTYHVLSKI